MSSEFSGVEHAFGRVEAKLDGIDQKLGRHAEVLAEHGVRLGQAEKDIAAIEADKNTKASHAITGRQVVVASLLGAFGTGVITWVVNFLTHH